MDHFAFAKFYSARQARQAIYQMNRMTLHGRVLSLKQPKKLVYESEQKVYDLPIEKRFVNFVNQSSHLRES